jgi:predicted dehydrogenase
MATRTLNMAVIGSGARGLWVLGHEFIRRRGEVRVLGFQDPRPSLRENVDWIISDMAEKGTPIDYEIATPADHREILSIPGLDFVLLATPNHLHAAYAGEICDRGLGLLIEKPMAVNVRDLNRIVAAERRNKVRVFVGFCMRYNRLFARAKELILSGAIGRPRLVSFQDYYSMGRHYFRGRNRFERMSGGLLVEKACHSFDLMSWLAGSEPVRTSCFGRLSVFTPKAGASERCSDCKLAADCFDAMKSRSGYDEPICVYNSEKDVDDTDAVLVELASGCLASYVECFYSPTVERRFSIVGDEGELIGSEERARLETRRLRDREWTLVDIDYGPGGHRGADPLMVTAALRYFRNEAAGDETVGSDAGRTSVLTALAAQRSAKEGRVVALAEIAADETCGAFGDEAPKGVTYDARRGEGGTY